MNKAASFIRDNISQYSHLAGRMRTAQVQQRLENSIESGPKNIARNRKILQNIEKYRRHPEGNKNSSVTWDTLHFLRFGFFLYSLHTAEVRGSNLVSLIVHLLKR
jgi:hypothetical protein